MTQVALPVLIIVCQQPCRLFQTEAQFRVYDWDFVRVANSTRRPSRSAPFLIQRTPQWPPYLLYVCVCMCVCIYVYMYVVYAARWMSSKGSRLDDRRDEAGRKCKTGCIEKVSYYLAGTFRHLRRSCIVGPYFSGTWHFLTRCPLSQGRDPGLVFLYLSNYTREYSIKHACIVREKLERIIISNEILITCYERSMCNQIIDLIFIISVEESPLDVCVYIYR